MNSTPVFDNELLARLAQRLMDGDAEALGELHDVLAPSLRALAGTLAATPAEADRVVEALFKELWHGRALLSDGVDVWLPRLFVRCRDLASPPRGPGAAR